MNCKYVDDVAYADIMHTTDSAGVSQDGKVMALVVSLRDRKLVKTYPMKVKTDAYELIQKFFVKECVPKAIVTDPAMELIGETWKKICRRYCLATRKIEAKSQQQDRAERWIDHIKKLVQKLMNYTGTPTKYWSYVVRHACAIHNHTALKSIEWRTPYEMLHSCTPYISVFWAFPMWAKVRYLNQDEKFTHN